MVAAVASAGGGLALALLLDAAARPGAVRRAPGRGSTAEVLRQGLAAPRPRVLAGAAWAAAWTACTGLWWLRAFYRAAEALVGLQPWPRLGLLALLAGWTFWAAVLAAALPARRAWIERRQAALARAPGRLAGPPPAAFLDPVRATVGVPADGTLLGIAAASTRPGGLGPAPRARSRRVPVGEAVPVVLTDGQANLHVLLLGATGSGKTNALLLVVGSAIARGHPIVVLDGKGSPDLRRRVQSLAAAAGREYRTFTLRGPTHWDPCRHADPTHLRDLIASIFAWDQPYFAAVALRFLGLAAQGLAAAGERPTLRAVADLANPDLVALRALLQRIGDREAQARLAAPLARLDESTRSGIAGLGHRLGRLTETEVGSWLEPGPDARRDLDLLEAGGTPGGPVALLSLDSLAYRELAADVGALAMQELHHVASVLMERGNARPVYVAIDEFSAFRAEQVLALLNRGREAGLRCVLATQDLADLERTGGRAAVDQILANTATKLCLRLDLRESAERVAATLGTRAAWQAAHRTEAGVATGQATAQVREQPWLEPSVLLQQAPGEGTLICKAPEISVRRLRLYRAGGRAATEAPAEGAGP